ncbi:carbon starvation CstA family protein [Caloramator proteoclasticus]|uniref:Carbon starvation protein n=1 Tax=Caloramator proteoclasticus DSM 10124 TaxID=1121262 RepID=A0A1M4YQV8_9CLOT|nr:carbon starvation protein A [Caloramator proteoclasticus]SHF08101.1 carbon starvation protein [Caloramator proteoclasticus DSM 10124]
MSSLWLIFIGIIVFLVAYVTYGAYLAKEWGIDPKRPTPSHTNFDNVDYVPTNSKVLLGHHFASIAGAGPIAGPIQAAIFGWLPVFLWIVIGSIFFGAVHDFGSLLASIRHGGKSIGEIIEVNVGKKGKKLFNTFAWLTLILVVAAFTDIVASAFAYNPEVQGFQAGPAAGTASVLFIFLAILFGFLVYRKGYNLTISTVIGVIFLFLAIYIGYKFPFIALSKKAWYVVLLVYIFLASTLPVWLLLQPRDYLNSFLLYAMLIGGFLGILVMRPSLQLEAFKGFTITTKAGVQYLFPILFVTVACGAISGFHSLVSSGTSAKQIDKEDDAKLVGYGAMLIEGFLAIIALISVAYVAKAEGAPAVIFASGVATFMSKIGIPFEVGKVFIILAFTAFALTSLDTATRLGRYIFEEYVETVFGKESKLNNMYISTLLTVLFSALLLMFGYQKIWPIFGTANQLLSALALLAVTAWLARNNKKNIMTIIPMIFMFAVTLTALVLLTINFFKAKNYVLFVIAILLFIFAIELIVETYKVLSGAKSSKETDVKA